MSRTEPAPLTVGEADKLARLLEALATVCDRYPGIMSLALCDDERVEIGDVEELRADLAMYAWILGAGR